VGYRRVLVGTDGSETASEAVAHAAQLAAATGAELVIATAFLSGSQHARELETAREQAPEDVRWAITTVGEADEKVHEARQIATSAVRGAPLKVRTHSASGDPATALLAVAEELSCDVIVVGNRGMAGASRFVLGSVPNKISHHAPCDVLIVNTVHPGVPA
jgi:nucleotide-binding universal stress UspA family protein